MMSYNTTNGHSYLEVQRVWLLWVCQPDDNITYLLSLMEFVGYFTKSCCLAPEKPAWWIWPFNLNIDNFSAWKRLAPISRIFLVNTLRNHLFFKHVFTHIILLCWESTNAHPGGVRFDDAVHSANVRWRHAKACAHSSHSAVRRRHKRICPWAEKHVC